MKDLKEIKILLAEDNKINAFVLKRFMVELEIAFDHAENGCIAVELCKNEYYDLILMNILMPVMDGFEATRLIRAFNTEVPIIAHTNYGGIRDKCLESGFNDYIRKPFSRDELIKIIRKNIEL